MSAFPLPDGWSPGDHVEDVVEADGLVLHRAGISARSTAGEALGSAADWRTSPVTRATFELLERIAILEARDSVPPSNDPQRWAYSRSNGVALHVDWASACRGAERELAERDRVLRAWLGEIDPTRVPFDIGATPLARTSSYEWLAFAFPADAWTFAPDVHVAGLFGFPRVDGAPLVAGYGARESPSEALEAALSESLQALAFLWGEPIPDRLPDPGPTPMAHLETFQYPGMHAVLREWLGGAHRRFGRERASERRARGAVRFIDLTPRWLAGRMHVARAVCDSAIPLAFGESPAFSHLPREMRLHPIA